MAEELEACGSWRFRDDSPTPSNAPSTLARSFARWKVTYEFCPYRLFLAKAPNFPAMRKNLKFARRREKWFLSIAALTGTGM